MGDTTLIIFSFSNWLRGFKPRVRPDFLREFYVARYRVFATALTMSNIVKMLKK